MEGAGAVVGYGCWLAAADDGQSCRRRSGAEDVRWEFLGEGLDILFTVLRR